MHEDSQNESALELRLKQTTRYMTIGLIAVLAMCVMLFVYVGGIKQSEQTAISNQQVQADATKDSDICKIYPDQELCILARRLSADPTITVVPKDGSKGTPGDTGDKGDAGRGVLSFATNPAGELVVTYSDGKAEVIGPVVGKNGIDGKDGRGILATSVDNGSLTVRFTDGITENLGIITGPVGQPGTAGASGADGATGSAGESGQPGQPGADGISVIDLKVDDTGTVTVYYSNSTSAVAGKVIVNTIRSLECAGSTLTITMMDGTPFSTTVDCTPDAPPAEPPAPAPAPATTPPATTTPK